MVWEISKPPGMKTSTSPVAARGARSSRTPPPPVPTPAAGPVYAGRVGVFDLDREDVRPSELDHVAQGLRYSLQQRAASSVADMTSMQQVGPGRFLQVQRAAPA